MSSKNRRERSLDIWSDESLPLLQFHVTHLLTRYARSVDRRDWGLVRSLFHEDSVDEHGFTAGSVEDFIASFSQRSAHVPEMMHLNSNTLILDRDPVRREALVETYCVAWSTTSAADMIPGSFYDSPLIPTDSHNSRLATIANRYVDLVSERDGELKFLFRRIVFEFVSVAEIPEESPFTEGMWRSSRASNDPTYTNLDEYRAEYLRRREKVYPGL